MPQKTFTSLEKAIDILDLYDINRREFSAKEVSKALNIPLSSTYKYLDFLVKRQLLQHRPQSKLYGLGIMIARLGYVLEKDMELLNISRPYMKQLSLETGETAVLTTLMGEEVLTLDCVEPQRMVTFRIEPGRRLPLNTGSTSKILLAYQDDAFIEQYLTADFFGKWTESSITDPESLRAELTRIRQQGYSMSESEVDIGACAVSVPVFNRRGSILAGLTIAGPSDRLSKKNATELAALLKKRAALIENDLKLIPS